MSPSRRRHRGHVRLCQDIGGAGGHIANIGVHGASVTLHLEQLWSQNITIMSERFRRAV